MVAIRPKYTLDRDMEVLLFTLKAGDLIRADLYKRPFNMSIDIAGHTVKRLANSQLIERIGSGNKVRYLITKKGYNKVTNII